MIQLPGIPTPPAATGAPRNVPVQLKKRLWTVESTNVTIHSTRMNGVASRRIASSHANLLAPVAGLGGVGGAGRLNADRSSDAMPATAKVHFVAACNAGPVRPDARTVPTQPTKPLVAVAFTLSQSTRMNVIGHAARTQPI